MIRSEHHEETVSLPVPASVGYQCIVQALRKVGAVHSAQTNLLRLSGSIGGGFTNSTHITVQVEPDGDRKCKIAVQGICKEGLLTGGNVVRAINQLLDNLEIPNSALPSPDSAPAPRLLQKDTPRLTKITSRQATLLGMTKVQLSIIVFLVLGVALVFCLMVLLVLKR